MNPRFVLMMVVLLTWWTATAAPTDADKEASTDNASDGVLQSCKNYPAEIYVLLDCSSSVYRSDFDKQKEFIVSVIERLDISPNATRVGLGVFATDFYHVLDVGDYPSKDVLIQIVRWAPYYGGNTYTDRALHGMRTHGFRADVVRPNVTKIGIVVTDGKSRHRTTTILEARQAREKQGIWLFAVGVGTMVDEVELSTFASVPMNQFIFHVESFNNLSTITTTLATSMCSMAQPTEGGACGRGRLSDVLFLYNAGGTSNQNLRMLKDFVAHVVSQLSMVTGNVRVGVISKSSQGEDINLDEFLRPENFIAVLKDQPVGQLAPLFKKVRMYAFQSIYGARTSAKKHIIAFVDDILVDSNHVIYQARLLKYNGVKIHVVSVGPTVDMSEIRRMASSMADIAQFDTYTDLQNPAKRKAFLDSFCAGREPLQISCLSNETYLAVQPFGREPQHPSSLKSKPGL